MGKCELDTARAEAHSFPGTRPPGNAVEIGEIRTGDSIYVFYRDSEGKYWYNTMDGLVFAAYMGEVQKERKNRRARRI